MYLQWAWLEELEQLLSALLISLLAKSLKLITMCHVPTIQKYSCAFTIHRATPIAVGRGAWVASANYESRCSDSSANWLRHAQNVTHSRPSAPFFVLPAARLAPLRNSDSNDVELTRPSNHSLIVYYHQSPFLVPS